MPPGAQLASISSRLHAHNYVGDTHWIRADVTAVRDGLAQLTWRADNQLGRTTASGEAVVVLDPER
jgi:hypothetical protein